MSSPHGEVATHKATQEKMCFGSASVICRAAVGLLFSHTFCTAGGEHWKHRQTHDDICFIVEGEDDADPQASFTADA